MTVIFHVYLWHLVTLEQMNSVHVMTHSIYQKRWRMPYIHSIGYKHEFSPNNKCCHIPVIWQVYDTTCHMTGIWQTYTLSKLSGDSRWKVCSKFTLQLAKSGISLHFCQKVYIRGWQTAKKSLQKVWIPSHTFKFKFGFTGIPWQQWCQRGSAEWCQNGSPV